MSDPLNVMDYIPSGLQAGVRNFTNTTALNSYLASAYSAAAANGAEVYHPAGAYLIDTSVGTLSIGNVTIRGSGIRDRVGGVDHGSVFFIKNTNNPAFTVGSGTSFLGVGFYYPDQTDTYTPTTYPACLSINAAAVDNFITVRDCVCYNAFVFMSDTDTVGNIGHVWVDSCGLFAFSKVFSFAQNLEKIQVINNDITFGVFTDSTTGAARYWRENGTVLEYQAGSGIWFQDNLVFGAKNGILINGPSSGSVQDVVLMDISGNSFDQTRYALYVQGSLGGVAQTTIVGNRFLCFNNTDQTLGGYAIYLNNTETTNAMTFTVTGNYFGQTSGHHIALDTTSTIRLDMAGNLMELCGFAQPTTANYANLALNAPNATVTISGGHLKGLTAQKTAANTYGVLSYSANTLVMSAVEGVNHVYTVQGAFGTVCLAGCSSIGTGGVSVTGTTPQVAACVWN